MIAPPGVATNIRTWAAEIEQLLPPLATGHLRDINDDSSGMVFITGTPYYWSALPAEAHAHQARALAEYRRFADTLSVLIRESPDDRLATFRDDTALVIRFISRDAASYETPERVLDEAVGALRRQVELMDGLYSASANTMLVPDTNALYWNTALDTWRLPWASSAFVVVLLPSVLKGDRPAQDGRAAIFATREGGTVCTPSRRVPATRSGAARGASGGWDQHRDGYSRGAEDV